MSCIHIGGYENGYYSSYGKELRELTGAGMMDCKKALGETNGDMDAAVEFYVKNGQAKAEKESKQNCCRRCSVVTKTDDKTAAVCRS